MKLFLLNETPTETQRLPLPVAWFYLFFVCHQISEAKGFAPLCQISDANKFKPKNQPTMETAPLLSLNHDQSL